ncbi:ABC-2 type transport system ATP-binding protein [Sphingobacterium psychroaquaticum]|uniref:ABC-2 type transport system ATP-binding protein n=2 Tax=Sphingobacterium psychroaquaticum TaxID=561061 RepID=A0A1X7I136_9SPHI|nr:ABC-2 type transport system ATP-binding protein [Sphingobacterium psychroaquaticum]
MTSFNYNLNNMIEIKDLTKYYGEACVLDIPALTIRKGDSIGLVGNNGAGKTTLFSLILDLIRPTTGEISVNDVHVQRDGRWKEFTSAFIDESFLIDYLTAEEYFYFVGELRGVRNLDVDALLANYSDFFNDEILGKKKYLRDLSKGNQKKVGIVATFIGNPELIILDEPFANLDPSSQFRLKKIILDLSTTGAHTILVSSHDLSHTVDVSNRIIALNKGVVVKDSVTSAETLQELEAFFAI